LEAEKRRAVNAILAAFPEIASYKFEIIGAEILVYGWNGELERVIEISDEEARNESQSSMRRLP